MQGFSLVANTSGELHEIAYCDAAPRRDPRFPRLCPNQSVRRRGQRRARCSCRGRTSMSWWLSPRRSSDRYATSGLELSPSLTKHIETAHDQRRPVYLARQIASVYAQPMDCPLSIAEPCNEDEGRVFEPPDAR